MFETMVAFLMVEHLHGRTFDPAAGRARLFAGAGAVAAAVPHRRRLPLHAGLYRRRSGGGSGRRRQAGDDAGSRASWTWAARSRNIDEVYRIAGEQLASRKTAEWLAAFDELEIPAGPVNSLDDVLDDPHLDAIGFFRHMPHPSEGSRRDAGRAACGSRARLPASTACRHGLASTAANPAGGRVCAPDEIDALVASGGMVRAGAPANQWHSAERLGCRRSASASPGSSSRRDRSSARSTAPSRKPI